MVWPRFKGVKLVQDLHIDMHSCKNANMRTSLDFPDPLFKHLKTRAALEGRTLRDLVLELVERGLNARETSDPQKRLQSRPLIVSEVPLSLPVGQMSNADLDELVQEEENERVRRFMARR